MPAPDPHRSPDAAKPCVFSVVEVLNVILIDDDRTVAVTLRRADGGLEAILCPRAVGDELARQLRSRLEDA